MIKWLAYDYPLRPGDMAQLLLPTDLTEMEAKRLCAFIHTLVIPEAPPQPDAVPVDNESKGER